MLWNLKYIHLLICVFLVKVSNSLVPCVIKDASYDKTYNFVVNEAREYIILFKAVLPSYSPSRVTVRSENSTKEFPLVVVVRQQQAVLSWQLPLIVHGESGGILFMESTRTLCPYKTKSVSSTGLLETTTGKYLDDSPIVSISTASKRNISFNLVVEHDEEFYVSPSTVYNISVSPSDPRYFMYNFLSNVTDGNWETVVLEIFSNDSICMTVSIQNASCPVYDLNKDITFEGYWETVINKGGVTISKQKFPYGFFLVFVAKGDDYDCTGDARVAQMNRTKTLTFQIKTSISHDDYITAVLTTLGLIGLFYVVFSLIFCCFSKRDYKPRAMEYIEDNQSAIDAVTPSTTVGPDFGDNVSFDETEYDTIAEAEYDKEIILGKPKLFLSDLARKDPRILTKKSYLYLWHVLTVALFYGLPVVQLVIQYQKVLNDTGNQDLCYYNFLCAHPLGWLSDFNHLFSNIGYVLFGVLFLYFVRRREIQHNDMQFDKQYGIPQHYGMFYAMGVSLIMEGVLSGSYHICPNHSNFQFDSSFMYVMAVLSMVKIYQTRHPDINATAYATFSVLAIAIVLGMFGVLEGNVYFWVGFTMLHIVTCLILTAQVYYMGCWKFDRGLIRRAVRVMVHDFWASPLYALIPVHKGRMVLLLLGNVCNWALAVVGVYHHERDFASYLLAIFMCNTTLYFVFYIVMKLLHRERINLQAAMYLLLSLLCASSALYFFYHKSISWALTPAQSRRFNQDCKLLRFYDFHDIWHFLSGIGMFFMFMVLLTLDDDLSHVHRSKISVF